MRIKNGSVTFKKLLGLVLILSLSYSQLSIAALGFLKLFIPKKYEQCPLSLATTHKQFCQSFKQVAQCHCLAAGMPKPMCNDMAHLYNRMLYVFSTLENACYYQKDTDPITCIDSWKCYRLGGKNSKNQSCSSTSLACR
jgi:hypothetical protein